MQNIDQYPALIETTAKVIASIQHQIALKQLKLSRLAASIEQRVAFDAELKNEAQRKVRRAEILSQTDHDAMQEELIELDLQRHQQAAELERYRNEFAVLKLEARKSIADVEF